MVVYIITLSAICEIEYEPEITMIEFMERCLKNIRLNKKNKLTSFEHQFIKNGVTVFNSTKILDRFTKVKELINNHDKLHVIGWRLGNSNPLHFMTNNYVKTNNTCIICLKNINIKKQLPTGLCLDDWFHYKRIY